MPFARSVAAPRCPFHIPAPGDICCRGEKIYSNGEQHFCRRKAKVSPLSKQKCQPSRLDWAIGGLTVGWVAISEHDIQRISVLSEVLCSRRTLASAAGVLGLGARQARRLLERLGRRAALRSPTGPEWAAEQPDLRGHPGVHAGPDHEQLRRLRPTFRQDAGGASPASVSRETLRRWMVKAGISLSPEPATHLPPAAASSGGT